MGGVWAASSLCVFTASFFDAYAARVGGRKVRALGSGQRAPCDVPAPSSHVLSAASSVVRNFAIALTAHCGWLRVTHAPAVAVGSHRQVGVDSRRALLPDSLVPHPWYGRGTPSTYDVSSLSRVHASELASGKLKALSSILSECAALGHTPLLLSHTRDGTDFFAAYCAATGARTVRLDGGPAGEWTRARVDKLSAASRGGLSGPTVAVASAAAPAWMFALPPALLPVATHAILGAPLDARLIDVVVVLDAPPASPAYAPAASALCDTVIAQLRAQRGVLVIRLVSEGALEGLLSVVGLNENFSVGAVSSSAARAVQPLSELSATLTFPGENEASRKDLLRESALNTLGRVVAWRSSTESALCARAANTGALAVAPVPVAPTARHARAPLGRALAANAAKAARQKSGSSKPEFFRADDTPLFFSGGTGVNHMYGEDLRALGAIDSVTGRPTHTNALSLPGQTRHRAALAPIVRAAIAKFAENQDNGGLHFSHAWGPPHPCVCAVFFLRASATLASCSKT